MSDEPTPSLEAAARDVLQQSLAAVQRQSKDLGERMTLLHASVKAVEGEQVVLLCDDGDAQRLMLREAARLRRLNAAGTVSVVDTIQVLDWAVQAGVVPDRDALGNAYARMASLDESLPKDLRATTLLGCPPWPTPRP